MAAHSRALANILLKNAPKKGVSKEEIKKEEEAAITNKGRAIRRRDQRN